MWASLASRPCSGLCRVAIVMISFVFASRVLFYVSNLHACNRTWVAVLKLIQIQPMWRHRCFYELNVNGRERELYPFGTASRWNNLCIASTTSLRLISLRYIQYFVA